MEIFEYFQTAYRLQKIKSHFLIESDYLENMNTANQKMIVEHTETFHTELFVYFQKVYQLEYHINISI